MKRRDFLKTAGGSVLLGGSTATAVLSGCAPEQGQDPGRPLASSLPDFSVWTWVHGGRGYDSDEWRRRFARLREAGFHAVLVGGGDTELISAAAHAEGLRFHRWFWTMNRNGDARATENHPEWFTVSRNLESSLDHPPYVGSTSGCARRGGPYGSTSAAGWASWPRIRPSTAFISTTCATAT